MIIPAVDKTGTVQRQQSAEQLRSLDNAIQQISDGELQRFLREQSDWLLWLSAVADGLREGSWLSRAESEVQREHEAMNSDVTPAGYPKSFAHPDQAALSFGPDLGPLFAFYRIVMRRAQTMAFSGTDHRMALLNEDLAETIEFFKAGIPSFEEVKNRLTAFARRLDVTGHIDSLNRMFHPEGTQFPRIVREANLTDLRYLYAYGMPVTDCERNMARFIAAAPEKDLLRIAEQVVHCYQLGLKNRNREYPERNRISVIWHIGEERLLRKLKTIMLDRGFEPLFNQPESSRISRQFSYDHRFDSMLFVDREFSQADLGLYRQAMEAVKPEMDRYSGTAVMFHFGEPHFQYQNCKSSLRFSSEQEKVLKEWQQGMMQIKEEFLPESLVSFTAISFPIPDIGSCFADVWQDMLDVNLLDTDEYEAIQQYMVDTLDNAVKVHVKGCGNNRTDITVALQKLKDPEKESLFVNCGADINIPVGEVFTSPQLKGTQGLLHIEDIYLAGKHFLNLELEFVDGWVKNYRCTNFPTEEENRNYVRDILFMPHDSLPMGEFAIGTNTHAYAMVKRHGILDVLHELIIEKMGPHFAIGDTCFLMNEDVPQYNRYTGKEMIAVENEKSCVRKENFQEAYTLKHQDITLPFESIAWITAITASGQRTDIIRDGRFVLPGTESLNVALDTLTEVTPGIHSTAAGAPFQPLR